MRRIILSIMLVAGAARAEPELDLPSLGAIDLPLVRPQLRLTADGSTPDSFGGAGKYEAGTLTLTGALELYHSDHVRVLAQLRLASEGVAGSMLGHDQEITESSVGATVAYTSDANNLYLLYAGAAIAESPATISDPQLMPTALGLGTARSGSVTWLYGGGFGYALGRSWLLPVGGLIWQASPSWTLSTLLPVFVDLRYRVTDKLAMSLVLAVAGNQYNFADDGTSLTVRLAEARLGWKTTYKLDRKWTLRAELGIVGPRRLQIAEGDTVMTSATSHGAGYLATGVSYAFDR